MQATQASSASEGLFSSLGSSKANMKYNGMIEISLMKRIRKSLSVLYDYIATATPPMFGMHSFITYWRILQLIGPSFLAGFHGLWGIDSIMYKFLNYFSILYAILPTSARPSGCPYFLIVYAIIMIIYFSFVAYAAYHFTIHQKLSQKIAMGIYIFTSTFCYIFANAAVSMIGEILAYMIDMPDTYLDVMYIVALVLGLIVLIGWIYIYSKIYLTSITFKADSMQPIYPETSIYVTNMTYFITFILAIVGPISFNPAKQALGIISIILYITSAFLLFVRGGFVKSTVQKLVVAVFISSGVDIIVFMVLESQQIRPTEYMIVVYILVIVIAYFFCSIFFKYYYNRCLVILDRINDDDKYFENVRSGNQLINLVVIGYRHAHPICISFSLFKQATERWPNHPVIWVLFAKFTAIYPEINHQLFFITAGVKKNHIKSGLAKQCLMQVYFIMSQREGNLVGPLKYKLDRVGKDLQQTKHKIRYMWDLVIQGNENELEAAIDKVRASVEAVDAEYLQILRQYPNNRFVARSYGRYLRDVAADFEEYKKMGQNVALLSRGIKVNPDLAHELGIKAFPGLPQTISCAELSEGLTFENSTSESVELTIDDNEQVTADMEMRLAIRESINALRIPGYFNAKVTTVLNLLIFYAAFLVGFTIYLDYFVEDIKPPLNFLYVTASMRTRLCQTFSFSHRYIIESINVTLSSGEIIFPVPDYTAIIREGIPPPYSIGSSWETKGQLVYIMAELVALEEKMNGILDFHTDNEHIQNVLNGIYGKAINFTIFSPPIFSPNDANPTSVSFNKTYQMMNLLQAAAEYIIQALELTTKQVVTPADYVSRSITQTFTSIYDIQNCILAISRDIIAYVRSVQNNISQVSLICMIALPLLFAIIHIAILIYNIKRIHKDKHLIYKAMISLPKNVVSKVNDQFKILKKESEVSESHSKYHDEDFNRQEENILKVFASSGDEGRSSASDLKGVIISTVFQILLHIVSTELLFILMQNMVRTISQAAPHINYITGSYSADVSNLAFVMSLVGYKHPTNLFQIPYTLEGIFQRIQHYTNRFDDYFLSARFGNPTTGDVPFSSLGILIEGESDKGRCETDVFPNSAAEVYSCSTSDSLDSYCQLVNMLMKNKVEYGNTIFSSDDPQQRYLWHIHLYHVFNAYFFPMFENIMTECYKAIEKEMPIYLVAAFILLAVAALFELLFFATIVASEKRQIFGLKLLLHCPGNAIIANHNITAVLNGDFSTKSIDTTTRDTDFFDKVVQELPYSIIILNINGIIEEANRSTELIYDVNRSEIIGQHFTEFAKVFGSPNPFEKIEKGEKQLSFIKNDSKTFLDVNVVIEQENILVGSRDVTQQVMYNKLIRDERKKSDQLLSSILPASLVARVQAGEKNISFAIQSCSILFMDIVSFTPWCGSNPASKVMTTLNKLFSYFDAAVLKYTTLTKIKCIGDCYMLAGGIFAESNMPAVHARETVDFGLDSLDAIETINQEMDEKLQMRVGINTGGPIVAGVLGTAKPTFEIIGPAINMAQQMEHHGVPKHVHISRSVYELIYGGNYIIKERGEVEIKNGKVVTYVVVSKKTE